MAGNQSISAQIRDKIKNYTAAGKIQQGRLVVNGVSMPQGAESDGSSAYPYIFTEGSSSVQIISPDGQSRQKMQFCSTLGAGAIRTHLRLVLSQDASNADLDPYVVASDGEYAWYGNTILKDSSALDMDVTTGYGLEIFTIPTPARGRYQVYINYYGGHSKAELTTTQLTLITDEGSAGEKQKTSTVPMHNAGELTLVKSFGW